MRFSMLTAAAVLLPTVAALLSRPSVDQTGKMWTNDCLSCSALCNLNAELCAHIHCFTQKNGVGGYLVAVCGIDTRPYYKYFDATYDLPTGYAPDYGTSRVQEMSHPDLPHGTGVKPKAAAAASTRALRAATDVKSADPFVA